MLCINASSSRLVVGSDGKSSLGQLARLGRQESDNIASVIEQIDPSPLDPTVARLSDARRVHIDDLRQFSSLALFMAYGLGILRPYVSLLE